MNKRIIPILLISLMILTGCGNIQKNQNLEEEKQQKAELNTTQEANGKQASTQITLDSVAATATIAAPEPMPTATPIPTPIPTPKPYEEDTNIYGNTMGNIYNMGLFLMDEWENSYLFNYYAGYSHRTTMSDGMSMSMYDLKMFYMNMLDNIIYCQCYGEEYMDGALIAFDVFNYSKEVLREGAVEYLQAVNDALYYTLSEDNTLRKFVLETGEEIVLVNEPVYYPVVYKDRVIFQLDSDGESLYSISLDGGEMTKLNNIHSHSPIVYKDKIYYTDENADFAVRRMELDGSNDEPWLDKKVGMLSVWDDKLYFVDMDSPELLSFVDLTKEEVVIETEDFSDRIETALVDAYGQSAVSGFKVEQCGNYNFSEKYILFYCVADINGMQYTDEYIYDIENDKIIVITEFFISVDDILEQMEEELQKEAEKAAEVEAAEKAKQQAQLTNRSYPPGNYSTGSVYGPKLTQEELNQVADVVQAFLDSYDFASMDDYTKVATAHDYLCNNVSYAATWSQNRANTAWGALVYHEAQCSGYARAMKALCDAMGVGCYYVHADENASNPSHQWNTVCVDGNWYIVDVQCNDSSGFNAFFLVSDDTYASSVGMSWDRNSIPACPNDY